MPLARHPHIFHPVQRVFDRSFRELRPDRAQRRPSVRLIFLAAETAA